MGLPHLPVSSSGKGIGWWGLSWGFGWDWPVMGGLFQAVYTDPRGSRPRAGRLDSSAQSIDLFFLYGLLGPPPGL